MGKCSNARRTSGIFMLMLTSQFLKCFAEKMQLILYKNHCNVCYYWQSLASFISMFLKYCIVSSGLILLLQQCTFWTMAQK